MQVFSRRFAVSSLAVALLAALLHQRVQADITCSHCGGVMHTNQPPQRCWNCEKPLYTPGPSPSPNPDFMPPDDLGPMSSGFELGVRFISTARGIRVTSVKPGSAAAGVLFVNDIISRAAYLDDNGRKRQLPTRSAAEMETVKHLAGQSQTALMIRRPSGEVRYAFVVFRPVGGNGVPVAAAARGVESGIEIDETGQAESLFDGPQDPEFVPQGSGSGNGAQDFFDGR
jgi:hypothetical protein